MRKTKWLILCVIVLFVSISPLLVGCKHKHEWSPLLYNDECHYIQCNKCFEKSNIEEHTYTKDDGKLCICGKRNYEHEHNFAITGGDDDFHWKSCTICGSITNKIKHSIKSGNEKYDKNDTHHWQVCNNCNIKIKYVEHEFSGFACKQCLFPRPRNI